MQLAYNECQKMEKVSLSALESQLNASKAALAQMNASKTNEILDNIFDIIIAVDADANSTLEDNEIDLFIQKVEGIMGLEISDEALKKNIIEKGRNIDSIISLLKDLLDDGVSDQLKEGERVIRVVD
jgi:glutamate-1-semialdehyde aminotransferase